jgi:hypothetical protein
MIEAYPEKIGDLDEIRLKKHLEDDQILGITPQIRILRSNWVVKKPLNRAGFVETEIDARCFRMVNLPEVSGVPGFCGGEYTRWIETGDLPISSALCGLSTISTAPDRMAFRASCRIARFLILANVTLFDLIASNPTCHRCNPERTTPIASSFFSSASD